MPGVSVTAVMRDYDQGNFNWGLACLIIMAGNKAPGSQARAAAENSRVIHKLLAERESETEFGVGFRNLKAHPQ